MLQSAVSKHSPSTSASDDPLSATISEPAAPEEVLVQPDGRIAHVSYNSSHEVAAIGIDMWNVKLIDAGKGADGLAWVR